MNLIQDVKDAAVRRYWLEDGLQMAKGNRLYILVGRHCVKLIQETHDPQWAGHPRRERMLALLGRFYFWPKMEDEIKLYVKTCLVLSRQDE